MSDKSTENSHLDVFTDESTRSRWVWVHKAISHAKNRNQLELLGSEAAEPSAAIKLHSVGG